jgi:hypothetical protein
MTNEQVMREALIAIRDSTYRSALVLRSIAERALQATEPVQYVPTPAGRAALEGGE